MRVETFVALSGLLLVAGCSNDPTPAGTRVFSLETAERIPEEARPRLEPVGRHDQTVPIGPGKVRIAFQMLRDREDGTQYLDHVSAKVVDAGGCSLRAEAIPPSVIRTEEPPEMTMILRFECERISWVGSRTVDNFSFRVHARGSVEPR